MARKPSGKPNGRPPKQINFEYFEKLCGFQCTILEISSFFRMDKNTLISKVEQKYGESFSLVYQHLLETGKCSIRRNQIALSRTSASMAIHVGKVYLKQKDIVTIENLNPEKALLELPDNERRQETTNSDENL